jgi:hypothetical protein
MTGRLLNIGEKRQPLNGQVFIRYSGLWGSPSEKSPPIPAGNALYVGFSGYWGPAYNETGIRPDKFIAAWADGMSPLVREEAFPDETSP